MLGGSIMDAREVRRKLFNDLEDFIDPKSENYKRFCDGLAVDHMSIEDIKECDDVQELLKKLESIGKFPDGNYTVLEEILRKATLHKALNFVLKTLGKEPEPELPEASNLEDGPNYHRKANNTDYSVIESSNAAKDWRILGRYLDVPDHEIDAIAIDYNGLKEQCHQVLRKWSDIKASQATISALIEALKVDYKEVAERLQQRVAGDIK